MALTDKQYKELSIKEFTQAAERYEGDQGGIYKLCKHDYPDILAEIEKAPFDSLLDAGCGPAPMLTLLTQKYPEKHYTGIDLTPKMIEVANGKSCLTPPSWLATARICRFRTIPSMWSSAPCLPITIRMSSGSTQARIAF